jgi:hypothetical protein
MKLTFENASKYFLWAAGIMTLSGPLLVMLMPVEGFKLFTGLTYMDESPQVFPIIGHWGTMVVGMGVLLFISAKNKAIRKTTVIFSTIEKVYMVFTALYCIFTNQPFAANYYLPLVADSSMVIGGIWYLIQSSRLKQE